MSNDNQNAKNPGSIPGNPDIVEAGRATRFTPGRSGNPSGRPSTKILTDELRKRLVAPIPTDLATELSIPTDSTYAAAVVTRLLRLAAAGQIPAIREIYERIEGKPPREEIPDDKTGFDVRVCYAPPLGGLRTELAELASTTDDEEVRRTAGALEMLLTRETREPDAEQSSR